MDKDIARPLPKGYYFYPAETYIAYIISYSIII